MLDACLFLFVMGLLALGLRKPFIWVLAYLYIDIVAPQKIGWTFMQLLPFSLIAFVAAFAGWLLADSKEGSRFTFRQGLILVLLIYCGITTLTADFPKEALEKWGWVWKAMVFAIFLPLTLRTRLRIEATALFMVLSIAAIVIAGGIKTLADGGGYGTLTTLVQDNSGIYEGSTLSMVAIASIPLILWLVRHGTVFPRSKLVMLFAGALAFACLLIPVGTQTRTGLICIGVLAILMLRSVRYRFLYIGAAGVLALAVVPFLPESYTARMSTIRSHDEDQSASTRVAVWSWTYEYAKDHPLGGGFDAFRGNSFTYRMKVAVDRGGVTSFETQEVTDRARAYHSSYFEMLGEQGWPGLALWLWLHGLGLWQMEKLRRRYRKRAKEEPRPGDEWKGSLASALQQGQIVYLVGSLFIGIAFQPFIFMLIGLQCALWSYLNRVDAVKAVPRFQRLAPGGAAASPT